MRVAKAAVEPVAGVVVGAMVGRWGKVRVEAKAALWVEVRVVA